LLLGRKAKGEEMSIIEKLKGIDGIHDLMVKKNNLDKNIIDFEEKKTELEGQLALVRA
jgi:hypothetical protein